MKRSTLAALTAGAALAAAGASGTAWAQTGAATPSHKAAPRGKHAAQTDAAASMVKPPEAGSGSTAPDNPDNMPIKRPRKPTNDRMMHAPPASSANAK